MNATTVYTDTIATREDYHLVALLSSVFGIFAITICTTILILIYRTKPRLHTTHHLLISNTCFASIFYSIVTIINYIFFLFVQWETSTIGCQLRAYFSYVGIASVLHSYMIQAISRIFFCVLSTKYRWLTKFKTHYYLIGIQWFVVLLITSSTLITKDIQYHPEKLCFIPLQNTLHVVCAIFAYYIIPLLITISIYLYIFYKMKRLEEGIMNTKTTQNRAKRDLEVLRNIVFLISIYILGGLPSIVYFLTPTKYPYLINLVTQSLAVALATLCTILLDRDIRQVIKNIRRRTTHVVPFVHTLTMGKVQQNRQTIKQINIY